MKRQNDKIGTVAGYCLICVVVVVICGGLALIQAQDAIDEAQAQQQALACSEEPRMCVEPDK